MCKDLELKRNDYLTIKQFKLKENTNNLSKFKALFLTVFLCIVPLSRAKNNP